MSYEREIGRMMTRLRDIHDELAASGERTDEEIERLDAAALGLARPWMNEKLRGMGKEPVSMFAHRDACHERVD